MSNSQMLQSKDNNTSAEGMASNKRAILDSGTYDAIIVGAGFSGLYQLHCLRDQ